MEDYRKKNAEIQMKFMNLEEKYNELKKRNNELNIDMFEK